MKLFEKIKNSLSNLWNKLNESLWFQEIKTRWENLESFKKNLILFIILSVFILLSLMGTFSARWKIHKLKKEVDEKTALIQWMHGVYQQANQFKHYIPTNSFQKTQSWQTYFQTLGKPVGIQEIEIQTLKKNPAPFQQKIQQTHLKLKIEDATLEQIIQYLLAVENGSKPVQLKNLTISLQENQLMCLTLEISGLSSF